MDKRTNFAYNSKYREQIENIKNTASQIYKEASDIWESIMITSTVDQINNFTFHLRKSESVKLQSQITDYVLENNATIQNHIVLQPLTITLTGEIGEKVKKARRKNIVSSYIQDKLNPISAFNSEFTTKAQQYINTFNDIVEKIDDTFSLINSVTDYILNLSKNLEPKQLEAFTALLAMWKSRELISINTDFCCLDNMVIQSVDFSQNEETNMKSEVSITLKQLTFTETKTVKKTSKGYNKNAVIKKKDVGLKSTIASGMDLLLK